PPGGISGPATQLGTSPTGQPDLVQTPHRHALGDQLVQCSYLDLGGLAAVDHDGHTEALVRKDVGHHQPAVLDGLQYPLVHPAGPLRSVIVLDGGVDAHRVQDSQVVVREHRTHPTCTMARTMTSTITNIAMFDSPRPPAFLDLPPKRMVRRRVRHATDLR